MSDTLLFQVKSPDNQNKHFVFGTMHLANKDAYTHAELAVFYMKYCEAYFGEMDLGSIVHEDIQNAFLLPEGMRFEELLTISQYRRMRSMLLKAFAFDIDGYTRFSPFYIQTLLSENILEKQFEMALDYSLFSHAKVLGKKTGGIETMEDQIRILTNISLQDQITSLRSATRNIARFRRILYSMSTAYANGDLRTIYRLSRSQLGRTRKLLLINRNETMAKTIFRQMSVESTFFSLGAAHLPGGKGVLKLLKNMGCTITPVINS